MHYRLDKRLENYPAVTNGRGYADLMGSATGRLVGRAFGSADLLDTGFRCNLCMYFGNGIVGP